MRCDNTYVFCRITAYLLCPMKLHYYPLDTQGCPMRLESCKYIKPDLVCSVSSCLYVTLHVYMVICKVPRI